MVARLVADGELPASWYCAVRSVPRHAFVPDVLWHETAHGYLSLNRADDPGAWLGMAHSDRALVVQVDDGRPAGLIGRYATSTMTGPSDLAALLVAVGAEPGMRVCEVGAGTGYTAAVLAHRIGAADVATIEIDETLARRCRRRLRQAGLGDVSVVSADGAFGYPAGAPFDRLVCTATVRKVPHAWVEQVRPGGVIVTSWGNAYHGEAMLRLTVSAGGTAHGSVIGPAPCEWLRGQRVRAALAVAEAEAALSRASHTTVDLADIAGDFDASFAIGLRVPVCASVFVPPDDQWFVDSTSGSWARLHLRPSGTHLVNEYGPRGLWGEIEAAYRWWLSNGRPTADAWRFNVTRHGTHIELPTATAIAV